MIVDVRMKQAENALKNYQADKDLNGYIKTHLKQFPKMGSRDRREVSGLIYDAIRVKQLFPTASLREQIWLGSVICEPVATPFSQHWTKAFCKQELPDLRDFTSKVDWLTEQGFMADWMHFFPWSDHISPAVELQSFYAAHLIHPITWVRVKSRAVQSFIKELTEKEIEFQQHPILQTAFALKARTKLDALKAWQQGSMEVQDLASQLSGAVFMPQKGESWLDACAGSGGKSLMLLDQLSDVRLFVSDVREETLQRLHERFKRAGIRSYSRTVADLTQASPLSDSGSFPRQFDVILADVPCSGSGTWGATPEMLISQRQLQISVFAEKQLSIAANLLPYVKPGGRFIYLTCSVYRHENEGVIEQLVAKHGVKLVQQQYFQASAEGGDVLFGAVLVKD